MAKNKNKNKKADGTEEAEPIVGYYDPNQIAATNGIYDSNNTYGRTPTNPNIGTFEEWLANQGLNKNQINKQRRERLKEQWTQAAGPTDPEYANTPEGEQVSNEAPDRHWNYLMAEAGALTPGFGDTQFGQFLNTTYKNDVMAGYDAAKMASGGGISYADYMSSIGWAPGQQVNTITGAPPRDTGNPYTSTSMPQAGGTGVQINQSAPGVQVNDDSFQRWLHGRGLNLNALNPNRRARLREQWQGTQSAQTPAPTLPAIPGADGLADARKRFLNLTPQQRGINTGTSFRPGRWAVYG